MGSVENKVYANKTRTVSELKTIHNKFIAIALDILEKVMEDAVKIINFLKLLNVFNTEPKIWCKQGYPYYTFLSIFSLKNPSAF